MIMVLMLESIGEDERSPLDNIQQSDKKPRSNMLKTSSLVWNRAGFPMGPDGKPKAAGKATQAKSPGKKQTPPKKKGSSKPGGDSGDDSSNSQGEVKKKRKKRKKNKGKGAAKEGTGAGSGGGQGSGLERRGAGSGVPFKVTLTPHLLSHII